MLVKRKEKKDQLDKLEGLKFVHHSASAVYSISKEIGKTMFTVSWDKNGMAGYSGSATCSRETIVRNIKAKSWVIVS